MQIVTEEYQGIVKNMVNWGRCDLIDSGYNALKTIMASFPLNGFLAAPRFARRLAGLLRGKLCGRPLAHCVNMVYVPCCR